MPIIRRGQDITSRSYYACFDQVWDPHAYGHWVNVPLNYQNGTSHRGLVFEAYNRLHSPLYSSADDHTWIEIESNDLTKYFRSHEALKGVESLENRLSGIDARNIFLRLEALKVSAVEPIFEFEEEEPGTAGLGLGLPPSPVPLLPINFATHSQDQFPSPPRSNASLPGNIQHPWMNSYSPVSSHTKPPLTVPEQLWILLDFIESRFKETVEELERLRLGGDISYNLLWTLCLPGHLVETKDKATGLPLGMRLQSWDYEHDGTKFTVRGDTYVWDGKSFKREVISVEIEHFEGIMKLDQVPIKPLTDQCKQYLIERGRIYQKYAGVHHLNYDAAITVSTQCSTIQLPAKGRVMLDAEGYSRYNSNNSREHQGSTCDPYLLRSPLPGSIRLPLRSGDEYKNDNPLPDEILCLTPPAHKAWSFAAEAWGNVLVNNLSEIVFNKLAFDQLVLKTDQKKLLKSLVESYSGGNKLAMDVAPGKNGELMIVLHGKLGAKKTLTAEAVSEHLKCPLYVVSSGELGTEANELERKIRSIFEMITAWRAVLLINEADILLETRNTLDIHRNSLVCAFLQALKYYQGVLILSTDRVHTFDKAFIPRISIAIHHPDLDQASRLLTWKESLVCAGVSLVDSNTSPLDKEGYITHEELGSLAKRPIDTCAIGQIIRGAQALSISDMEPLRMSHLSTVLKVAEQFEADSKELELTEDTTARKEGW